MMECSQDIYEPLPGSSNNSTRSRIIVLCVVTILAGLFGFSMMGNREDVLKPMNFRANTEEQALDFEIYNYYTQNNPVKDTIWKYLAEPHREATLVVKGASNSDKTERYVWEIENAKYTGASVTHTFKTVGKYDIKLTDTQTGEDFTTNVMCKYVRREIRSLTEDDRTATLDALQTLYKVDTEYGQEIYGPDYLGMNSFLKIHLDGAGMKDCDHWHDDAGIMTHHVGYTLLVEQVMQLVDPTVSMPYWDYTIDDYLYDSDLSQSEVFGDDWFGEMSPDHPLKTIGKGRWAYLQLPNAGDYNIVNPFGLLRTPWNVNKSPFITRHNYLGSSKFTIGVGCSELYTAFKKTTVAELNEQLNGETHGSVHIQIGGQWDGKYEAFVTHEGFVGPLALISKILWRAGYLRLPDSCDAENAEGCFASCPAELYESQGKKPYDVLKELNILDYIVDGSKFMEYDADSGEYHLKDEWGTDAEDHYFLEILNGVCDPGMVGEMYSSAAPADPSFWILHPASERFMDLRRLVVNEYPMDETWSYAHDRSVASDNGWVCDWSNVKEYLDMPVCKMNEVCSGHNPDDILEFEFLGSLSGRTFSNVEFYEFMHPFTEDLPYMYDNYDFDHCTEQGYDFLD